MDSCGRCYGSNWGANLYDFDIKAMTLDVTVLKKKKKTKIKFDEPIRRAYKPPSLTGWKRHAAQMKTEEEREIKQ